LWLRYPAISPDGQTIAFTYRGRIYTVPSQGGTAIPLTLHDSYAFHPVWSRDGQSIAFASDRHGNFDVFVMPAAGGEAHRLTFHSAPDVPTDFTPDGSAVLFESSRVDAAAASLFPSGVLPELYEMPVIGGRVVQILTTPAQEAQLDPAGRRIVYQDRKGYEDAWRKHHTSSVTRDIFIYDSQTRTHTRVSPFEGEDRDPVWSPAGDAVLYLSERDGTSNIWRAPADRPDAAEQLTRHTRHPVRFLSASNDGTLAYSWNGELYVRPSNATDARKVNVTIRSELEQQVLSNQTLGHEAREMAVSPDGKEIAFVMRGEVFVTSVDYATTKRVTNTPQQERSVSFSPDGRCVLYAAERGESWDVYKSCIRRDAERRFTAATVLQESSIAATSAEEFQPRYSPDGKEVAYLENRTTLRVANLGSGERRTILSGSGQYSYEDGDLSYEWSPDGRWFLIDFAPGGRWPYTEVGLISAAGGQQPVNLTKSGYFDSRGRWMANGMLIWFTDRNGMRAHGSWGSQLDVYSMFLTQAALDRFDLSKEELELREPDRKPVAGPDSVAAATADTTKPLEIELDRIEERVRRLTIHSSDLADALVTPDGAKLVYLARFESGYDLWVQDLRAPETRLLAKVNVQTGPNDILIAPSIALDAAGDAVFVLSRDGIVRVALANADRKPVPFQAELALDLPAEREYLFEHVWRQVREKFYDPGLHGVDWDGLKRDYARFVPHITNNYDFSEMLSELLGELNASHTGARFRPTIAGADVTTSLGLIYDESRRSAGLVIAEVIEGGPLDQNESRVRAGHIITAIDGVDIGVDTNPFALLNRKLDEPVLLAIRDPATGETWEEVTKPISLAAENELLYRRWVEQRREETERLSGGRLGYVHVRAMDGPSFRTVFSEALGRNADKEALIVDTRFNGGGWLHDDLATFLSGQQYVRMAPRGDVVGSEPLSKWQKPSVVLMSESNYSDGHFFPYTYTTLEIGDLVGMPVPGTATAVWWERLQDPSLVFGIPQVGILDANNRYLENQQLQPDHEIWNDWGSSAEGRDKQLEKAVEVLLQKLSAVRVSTDR
jgi:Tol biopolymer transport system component/C-terminal processing protease CtpA/Prc